MNRDLLDAVRDLARAYQAALLYPEGHPAVRSTVSASWSGLVEILRREGGLTLRVGRDQLRLEGEEEPVEAGPALQSLISTLHELDVSTIDVSPGLPEEELVRFVDALIEARREGGLGRERLRVLAEADLPHVRLEFIDYGAWSFQEGAKRETDDADEGDEWLELFEAVSSDEPQVAMPEPEVFAEKVGTRIALRGGRGIGELRDVIRKAHEGSRGGGTVQMGIVHERVLRFMSALTPELRSDLLRVDPERPQQMLSVVTELADYLDPTDLLKSLDGLENVGRDTSVNLIPLLSKLVLMSDGDDDRGARLRERLDQWGLTSISSDLEQAELEDAVAEVLQKRGDLNPNPEAYGKMLEELVRGRLEGAGEVSSAELYGDAGDPHELRLHSLDIALRLLREDLTEISAGPLARLSLDMGLLLERGRLESLREAAASAVEVSRRTTAPEALERASRGFLATFAERETIDAILRNGAEVGGMSGTALYLLGLGGEESTRAVVEILEEDAESPLASDLVEFLDAGSTTVLVSVVRERVGEDESRCKPTAHWLRAVKADKAIPALEVLFDHPAPLVRRTALADLCLRTEKPELIKKYLSRGLQDQDRRVAEQAFRILLTLDSRQATDLLIEILTNVIEGRERSTYWAIPLASRLVRGGSSQGLDRLVSLCGNLRWSWRARHGRLALALSTVLEPFAGRPDIAKLLRQIRYSPAGLYAKAQLSVRRKQEVERP